jgi:diguanylate cyclase (GGDEF)-like protein
MVKRGQMFAIAFADLDHFKQLNDTHGHEAGDRALRIFAQSTQDVLREHDVIARWGGEEFVIVLPELDRHQAFDVLERIRTRLAAAHTGGHPTFTASFGLTDSTCATSLEDLVHIADTCLYSSKEGGRNRVTTSDAATTPTGPMGSRKGKGGPRRASPALLRPPLHQAVDEEDPRASGTEIR